jgi:TolB protein
MNRRKFVSQLIGMGITPDSLIRSAEKVSRIKGEAVDFEAAALSPPALAGLTEAVPKVTSRIPPAFPAAKLGGKGGSLYMYNYYLPPPSSTPVFPAWSPSGEEIAFSLQGSIWRMKVGQDVAYEMISAATYDSSPAWSPDGRRIVYTAEEDSRNINLKMIDLATGETTPLTSGEHVNLDPVWSPDGTRIAFVSSYPDGWFNIFTMAIIDGKRGDSVQITIANDYGRDRLYFGRIDSHIEPTWSSDSKEIILISNRGTPLGSGSIWRMPVEPNGMAKAKEIHREETLYQTRPDWSPDGTRIIYSSYLGDQYNNLYVLPSSGGDPYKMTFGNWDHFHPRWSPDSERIVYVSNQNGLTDLRILEAVGGKETKLEIHQKVYKHPRGWLDVRVTDAQTSELTPARIYLRAGDGKTYTPDDAAHRVGRAGEHLFHTAGRFRIQVPPGPVKVEAAKGIEHLPLLREVNIKANTVTSVTLALSRASNIALKGWYGGSEHVHMSYGGTFHNRPETLMSIGAAEDLSIVGAVVANKDNRIMDYQYFRGALDEHSTKDRLLYFNEEYRPPFLGHLTFLNLRTHLISPFTTGYEGTAIPSIYPSNTDILRLVQAEGGIGGYVHPFDTEPSTIDYGRARGLPIDVALGTITYLEVSSAADDFSTSSVWHRLLNCGFRLTPVAGEDSENDLYRNPVAGGNRVYGFIGPKLDWDAWIEAIRKGATFVTNGPILEFSVQGRILGDELHLPSQGGSVNVRGSMKCIVPVEQVEVLNNGRIVLTIPLSDAGQTASFDQRIEVKRSGWYTLRAYTTHPVHPLDVDYAFAETSPIYVFCGNRPIRSAEDAEYFIKWIDAVSRMAEADTGWRSPKEKAHVLGQFEEARRIFVKRSKEPE